METYDVVPLVGIGPFRLGTPRRRARELLAAVRDFAAQPAGVGYGDRTDRRGCVQLGYDAEADAVDCVEVFWGGAVEPVLRGQPVFDRGVEVVVSELGRGAGHLPADFEVGCVCLFPELELRFWRPAPADSAEDVDRRHFWSVAVGSRGYFSRHVPGPPPAPAPAGV